jgi:hypothetical protein
LRELHTPVRLGHRDAGETSSSLLSEVFSALALARGRGGSKGLVEDPGSS